MTTNLESRLLLLSAEMQAVANRWPVSDSVPCLMISDWHLGAHIETGFAHNAYNVNVAEARLREAFDQFIKLMVFHEGETPFRSARIMLGGDMLEGFLNLRQKNVSTRSSDRTLVAGAALMFRQQLERLEVIEGLKLGGISDVHIVAVGGNHGEQWDKKKGKPHPGDEVENLDGDFYAELQKKCLQLTKAKFGRFNVTLEFDSKTIVVGKRGETKHVMRASAPVFFKILDTTFMLSHGLGFRANGKATRTHGVTAQSALEIEARRAHETLVSNMQKGEIFYPCGSWQAEMKWHKLVVLSGHHHIPVIDPERKFLCCGSLRGPDDHVTNRLTAQWYPPSAMFWITKHQEGVTCAQVISARRRVASRELGASAGDLNPYTRLKFDNFEELMSLDVESLRKRA